MKDMDHHHHAPHLMLQSQRPRVNTEKYLKKSMRIRPEHLDLRTSPHLPR